MRIVLKLVLFLPLFSTKDPSFRHIFTPLRYNGRYLWGPRATSQLAKGLRVRLRLQRRICLHSTSMDWRTFEPNYTLLLANQLLLGPSSQYGSAASQRCNCLPLSLYSIQHIFNRVFQLQYWRSTPQSHFRVFLHDDFYCYYVKWL